jgi:hypothetical protein
LRSLLALAWERDEIQACLEDFSFTLFRLRNEGAPGLGLVGWHLRGDHFRLRVYLYGVYVCYMEPELSLTLLGQLRRAVKSLHEKEIDYVQN